MDETDRAASRAKTVPLELELRVHSRRGWKMTERVTELAELPEGLVLDGELVALNDEGCLTGRSSSTGSCTATTRSRSVCGLRRTSG